MAEKPKAQQAVKEQAAKPEPAPDPPDSFDLVGEDGRRIHRSRSLAFCEEEKKRIRTATGERLKIEPASGFGAE